MEDSYLEILDDKKKISFKKKKPEKKKTIEDLLNQKRQEFKDNMKE